MTSKASSPLQRDTSLLFAGDLDHPSASPELRARFAEALSSTIDLALSDLVVACPVVPERKATAARRAGFEIDTGALRRIARSLGDLGRTAREQGVRICFHPHVGTAVETPEEIAFAEVDAPARPTPFESLMACSDYVRRWEG